MLNTAIGKKISLIGLAAFMVSTVAGGISIASVQGTRNTAIGLSALSLYSLVRGNTGVGLLTGAGAAYAWKKNSDSRKHHRYYKHYGSGSRHYYRQHNYRH
jgi:hypothetical protein